MVGTLGSAAERLALVTAMRRDLALLGLRRHHRHGVEHAVDMAAEQIVERRAGAAIVDDVDLDAGLGLEQLGREIERAAGAAAGAEA